MLNYAYLYVHIYLDFFHLKCSLRRGQISTVYNNGKFTNNYTHSVIERVAWVFTSMFFSLCYLLAMARSSHNIFEQMATISLGNKSVFQEGRRERCRRKGGNKRDEGLSQRFYCGRCTLSNDFTSPLDGQHYVATFLQVCLRRHVFSARHMAIVNKIRFYK